LLSHHYFEFEPVAPFQLELTTWILRRRASNNVDRWDGHTYRRVLMIADEPIEVAVTQAGSPVAPYLSIHVKGGLAGPDLELPVVAALERLLGLRVDLGQFYTFVQHSRILTALVNQFCGSKPPRFPTYFETLVNAIACQQVSLTVGILLLNRLAEAYGPRLVTADGNFHAFPRPQDLANADIEDLRQLGFSRQKARYVIALAQSISRHQLDLAAFEALDDAEAVARLCRLKGIGRWSAEYFLLRGLGRTHIFPGDDVGARNNLQRWLGLPNRLDYAGVHEALAGWKGYDGLIYFQLLLQSLTEQKVISPRPALKTILD
jgi:DNA-3-methyladenine glycosylase II